MCSRIRSILDSRGWFGTPRKTFRVFLDQKIQTHKDFLGFGCPKNSLNFGAQKTFEVFFGSEKSDSCFTTVYSLMSEMLLILCISEHIQKSEIFDEAVVYFSDIRKLRLYLFKKRFINNGFMSALIFFFCKLCYP